MSADLYSRRLKEHLDSAKMLCGKNDYVQAGEKVWGALSALVNALAKPERRAVDQKQSFFEPLVRKHLAKAPHLKSRMLNLKLANATEIFLAVYGLHKFFYGGQDYSNQHVSQRIPFFIELLEHLWQSECSSP